MAEKQAYPLSWPEGWKRTSPSGRIWGRFSKRETQYRDGHSWTDKKNLKVSDGVTRILTALEAMGCDRQEVIISTNVRVRLDGLPRSGEKAPDDPGAAVYWRKTKRSPVRSMAIDRYTDVADNLAAIAATLDAMRAIERHGGAEILDRTFTGFSALPAQASSAWRDTLRVLETATMAEVDAAFRELARKHHPDTGDKNEEAFRRAVQAREDARKELGARL